MISFTHKKLFFVIDSLKECRSNSECEQVRQISQISIQRAKCLLLII